MNKEEHKGLAKNRLKKVLSLNGRNEGTQRVKKKGKRGRNGSHPRTLRRRRTLRLKKTTEE